MNTYPDRVFHLAIPSHDLDLSHDFYIEKLGFRLARRYNDRITMDFFGDQVVCHLSPDNIDKEPKMYPRHFGMTFKNKEEFDAFHSKAVESSVDFFKDIFVRFKDKQEEHYTFFLKDPSNNLLEFKYYHDPSQMY